MIQLDLLRPPVRPPMKHWRMEAQFNRKNGARFCSFEIYEKVFRSTPIGWRLAPRKIVEKKLRARRNADEDNEHPLEVHNETFGSIFKFYQYVQVNWSKDQLSQKRSKGQSVIRPTQPKAVQRPIGQLSQKRSKGQSVIRPSGQLSQKRSKGHAVIRPTQPKAVQRPIGHKATRHTGENICREIDITLDKLSIEKVVAATRDGAKNMAAGAETHSKA
ncbi:hypothetical protein GPALN_004165 [Globodera pallida]|nr:hypothetical protein GPALN_004165 [Globodera pallida]